MSRFIHLPAANSIAPLSRAVGITNDATFYQLGAQFPEISDPSAPPRSTLAFGDTYTQTISTLNRLKSLLQDLGLSKRNLTNMRVYLAADTSGARMDFDGFNKAYTEFFKDQNEQFPSRTVLQVAAFVNPGWLIEIEATAAQ